MFVKFEIFYVRLKCWFIKELIWLQFCTVLYQLQGIGIYLSQSICANIKKRVFRLCQYFQRNSNTTSSRLLMGLQKTRRTQEQNIYLSNASSYKIKQCLRPLACSFLSPSFIYDKPLTDGSSVVIFYCLKYNKIIS